MPRDLCDGCQARLHAAASARLQPALRPSVLQCSFCARGQPMRKNCGYPRGCCQQMPRKPWIDEMPPRS